MYLLCAECKYLGYTLSKKGISPDHEKLKAVETYPIPKKLKDVRAFLGFIGFYRKFIHNFSEIAKPLTDLTKKNTKFVWSSQCSSAFQILKQKLISPPILAYPNYNYEFILTTDASNVGISAILSQQINGEERPIAFSSRVLSETETRLCTTERELLAILFGCKQYRYIIFGYKFKIITDHSALQWLQNLKDPHSKLYRWSLKLSEFDFYIEHRSGKNIAHADALSRYIGCINTDISPEYYPNIDFLEIAQQQAEDEQCRRLAQSKNYTVNDSGLLINVLDNNILVPSKMRDIVLQLYHDNPLSGRVMNICQVMLYIFTCYVWRWFGKLKRYLLWEEQNNYVCKHVQKVLKTEDCLVFTLLPPSPVRVLPHLFANKTNLTVMIYAS